MGVFGIWWSNGFWIIGENKFKGQTKGYASIEADDYCPNKLMDEKLIDIYGIESTDFVNFFIECKSITIKSRSLQNTYFSVGMSLILISKYLM